MAFARGATALINNPDYQPPPNPGQIIGQIMGAVNAQGVAAGNDKD